MTDELGPPPVPLEFEGVIAAVVPTHDGCYVDIKIPLITTPFVRGAKVRLTVLPQ